MDAGAWVAAVAAVIAVGALYFTRQQAKAAASQTELVKRQTDLQQRMHEDAAQPYVWADIRPDEEHGFVFELLVKNEGPTVATDVTVTFDKPLPSQPPEDPSAARGLWRLASMPPGRTMRWWLKSGPDWLGGEEPRRFVVTIECTGPFGPAPTLQYELDVEDFGEAVSPQKGSLYAVTKAVEGLTKVVKKQ